VGRRGRKDGGVWVATLRLILIVEDHDDLDDKKRSAKRELDEDEEEGQSMTVSFISDEAPQSRTEPR